MMNNNYFHNRYKSILTRFYYHKFHNPIWGNALCENLCEYTLRSLYDENSVSIPFDIKNCILSDNISYDDSIAVIDQLYKELGLV